jgi:hypothetical protein
MQWRFSFAVGCLSLFLFALLCSTCSKEYSYEGSRQLDSLVIPISVPAAYTIAGAPNDCINATVNGTYMAGIGLSSSETVGITVNVTTPGNFSISTDTVNGISFSKAGTFAAAGIQSLVLQGRGRPFDAGVYSVTPKFSASQCSFDVPVQNAPPFATYVLESGAGNGQATCVGRVLGTYAAGTPLNASNYIDMSVYVVNLGNFTVLTKRVNGMVFSYSGRFTTTGSQYIMLMGSGTPLTVGKFSVVPQIVGPHPLGGEACAATITVQ